MCELDAFGSVDLFSMPMQLLRKTLQGYVGAGHQTVINDVIVSCSLFSLKKKKKKRRFAALFVNVHCDIWTYFRARAEIPNQTRSKPRAASQTLFIPENNRQQWSERVQTSWHARQTATDLLQLSDHVCYIHFISEVNVSSMKSLAGPEVGKGTEVMFCIRSDMSCSKPQKPDL